MIVELDNRLKSNLESRRFINSLPLNFSSTSRISGPVTEFNSTLSATTWRSASQQKNKHTIFCNKPTICMPSRLKLKLEQFNKNHISQIRLTFVYEKHWKKYIETELCTPRSIQKSVENGWCISTFCHIPENEIQLLKGYNFWTDIVGGWQIAESGSEKSLKEFSKDETLGDVRGNCEVYVCFI